MIRFGETGGQSPVLREKKYEVPTSLVTHDIEKLQRLRLSRAPWPVTQLFRTGAPAKCRFTRFDQDESRHGSFDTTPFDQAAFVAAAKQRSESFSCVASAFMQSGASFVLDEHPGELVHCEVSDFACLLSASAFPWTFPEVRLGLSEIFGRHTQLLPRALSQNCWNERHGVSRALLACTCVGGSLTCSNPLHACLQRPCSFHLDHSLRHRLVQLDVGFSSGPLLLVASGWICVPNCNETSK